MYRWHTVALGFFKRNDAMITEVEAKVYYDKMLEY